MKLLLFTLVIASIYGEQRCIDSLSCVVFNASMTCNQRVNNATLNTAGGGSEISCLGNVCLRCVGNETMIDFAPSCLQCSTAFYDNPLKNVCMTSIGLETSVLCSVVVPVKNVTSSPKLSDGAVAGVLIGLLVATAAVFCLVNVVQHIKAKKAARFEVVGGGAV